MASWGVAPHELARRFSEEQLIELVPSLVQRRAREGLAYQLGQIASAVGTPPANVNGVRARDQRYASGRVGRTYGSANHPLTGAELEAAMRDVASRVGTGRGRPH